MLDGGKRVSPRRGLPRNSDGLNDRMRSRLQRGLVTEISRSTCLAPQDLGEAGSRRSATDPSFEIPNAVVELLADKLTESGRN